MRAKKWLAMLVGIVLMVAMMATVGAAEPAGILDELGGTYIELFPVICAPEYDSIWLEVCKEVIGEEQAETTAQMLKNACQGELYGEEAVSAFADNPESVQFNCSFINSVAQFTIEGNKISGIDERGATVFSYTYTYKGQDASMGADMAVYQADDADAGEFTYFLFAPDVPDETFHIEFRYGDDLAALNERMTGKYGYWLAAGIPVENTAYYAEQSIRLFCEENLMQEEAA